MTGNWLLEQGDCREVVRRWADEGIRFDAVVTDPPYDLTSIVKRFDKEGAAPAKSEGPTGVYGRASRGFMGQQWDGTGVAFDPETWRVMYDALKPGAHLVAFGGTRTYHRMVCAIEDAGFEIRDTLMWLYSTGFPKSHNLNNQKGIRICGCETRGTQAEYNMRCVRNVDISTTVPVKNEQGETLQSSVQEQKLSVSVLRNTEKNVVVNDEGIKQPIVERRCDVSTASRQLCECKICKMSRKTIVYGSTRRLCDGTPVSNGCVGEKTAITERVCSSHRSQSAEQHKDELRTLARQPKSQISGTWQNCRKCGLPVVSSGIGTALKPAVELIVLARKPLDGTVAANVLEHGVGGLNIDVCRVAVDPAVDASQLRDLNRGVRQTEDGRGMSVAKESIGQVVSLESRWPANVLHDGSEEVTALFPNAPGQLAAARRDGAPMNNKIFGERNHQSNADPNPRGDKGSAARFFPALGYSDEEARFHYSAKANKRDRAGSAHPTVKPQSLMKWLIRLITPPGGLILEPFGGSGSTLQAAVELGFDVMGVEMGEQYCQDIRNRMEALKDG